MPAWLTNIPLWLWLVWVVLVWLAAVVIAPRRRGVPSPRNQRLLRIAGQVLLGAAMFTIRAETAAVATLLAALGGAVYGNASGETPRRGGAADGPDGEGEAREGDDERPEERPDSEDGSPPPR